MNSTNLRAGIPEDSNSVAASEAGVESSPVGRVWAFLRGPYPTLVSRVVLGGMLLLAGLTKLGVPGAFADNINSYQMGLPPALVKAMAVGLPPVEIGLGLWLLVGLFTRFAAAISGLLMAVFTIAITQAWLRGLIISCGCVAGGEDTANPLGLAILRALGPVGDYLANEKAGPEAILRDIVLLLMAVHLIFVPTVFALDALRRRPLLEEEE